MAPCTCPATPGTTPPGCRGTSRSTSARPRSPTPRPPPRWRRRPGRRRGRPARRAAEHRPQRRPAAPRPRRRRRGADLGHDRAIVDPDPASPASRAARSGSLRSNAAAAHGLAVSARLLARRRHRRLLPRRRHRVVRPQARPADQQPHRGRDRHRPTARWCAPTPTTNPDAVLGAARRWRQLRRRDRTGVPQYPIATAYAGMLRVGRRRPRAGAPRVGRLGAAAPTKGQHVVPRPAAPADARPPPFLRAASSSSSTAPCSAGREAAAILARPARAASGDRHLRSGARRSRWSGCTWTPRARRRSCPTPRCSAGLPAPGVDAFVEAVGPDARSSLLMAELRQLGGALGRPHEDAGALSTLDGQFVTFAGAIAATPEMAAQGHRRRVAASSRRLLAVRQRTAVPQLRRDTRSTPAPGTAARPGGSCRQSARRRPRWPVRREPPGDGRLTTG